jgi:DNA-binding CsgD family transcriptional regulator
MTLEPASQTIDPEQRATDAQLLAGDVTIPLCHIASVEAEPLHIETPWSLRRHFVAARAALLDQRLEDARTHVDEIARWTLRPGFTISPQLHTTYIELRVSLLLCQDSPGRARRTLLDGGTRCQALASRYGAALRCYMDWKLGRAPNKDQLNSYDHLAPAKRSEAVISIFCLCLQSALEFERLHLAVAARLATEAMSLCKSFFDTRASISALPATLLAQVSYQQGRLDEAEGLIRSRLASVGIGGFLDCAIRAYPLLSRISAHRGETAEAAELLNDAERIATTRHWASLMRATRDERSRITRTCGAPAVAVTKHLAGTDQGFSSIGSTGAPVAISVRNETEPHFLTFGPFQGAAIVETRPLPAGTRGGSFTDVEKQLHLAADASVAGRKDFAHQTLIGLLRIGLERGLFMVFADAGPPMHALMSDLYHSSIWPNPWLIELRPYIGTLLAAIPTDSQPIGGRTIRKHQPLSCRERTVLRLMTHGLSNKKIAQCLGITPETVKSHVKSIFTKLGAHTRAQSVAKAEAAHLL